MVFTFASASDVVHIYDVDGASSSASSSSATATSAVAALIAPSQPTRSVQTSAMVYDLQWNHNNSALAFATTLGQVDILSASECKTLLSFTCSSSLPVTSLCYSSGSRYILAGCGNTLRVFDMKYKNQPGRKLSGFSASEQSRVTSVDLGQNDSVVASCTNDGDILIHALATASLTCKLTCDNEVRGNVGWNDIQFSPHRSGMIATAGAGGMIALWDSNAQALNGTLKPTNSTSSATAGAASSVTPIGALRFSTTSSNLLASIGGQRLCFYDVSSRKCIRDISCDSTLTCIDYHSDGCSLVVGSEEGHIMMYDIRSATKPSCVIKNAHRGRVNKVRFSHGVSTTAATTGAAARGATPSQAASTSASAASKPSTSTASTASAITSTPTVNHAHHLSATQSVPMAAVQSTPAAAFAPITATPYQTTSLSQQPRGMHATPSLSSAPSQQPRPSPALNDGSTPYPTAASSHLTSSQAVPQTPSIISNGVGTGASTPNLNMTLDADGMFSPIKGAAGGAVARAPTTRDSSATTGGNSASSSTLSSPEPSVIASSTHINERDARFNPPPSTTIGASTASSSSYQPSHLVSTYPSKDAAAAAAPAATRPSSHHHTSDVTSHGISSPNMKSRSVMNGHATAAVSSTTSSSARSSHTSTPSRSAASSPPPTNEQHHQRGRSDVRQQQQPSAHSQQHTVSSMSKQLVPVSTPPRSHAAHKSTSSSSTPPAVLSPRGASFSPHASATAQSSADLPATSTAGLNDYQVSLLRSMLDESLYSLRTEFRSQLTSMHMEMLKQFHLQQVQHQRAFEQQTKQLEALVKEVTILREDAKQHKRLY